MTLDKVLVFNIEAQFGFFRIAETTRATISFPFTRTSIIGVIGAMLGQEKNSYWVDGNEYVPDLGKL